MTLRKTLMSALLSSSAALAISGFGVCGAWSQEAVAPSAAPRDWTPHDSVQARYVVNRIGQHVGGMSPDNSAIFVSPSGRNFYFVTSRGDLACDCNRSTLSVFAVPDVIAALNTSEAWAGPPTLTPWRTVEMGHRRPAISEVRWDGDDAILFLGHKDPVSSAQLYRLDLMTGRAERLTAAPNQRDHYGLNQYARQGSGLIAFAQEYESAPLPYPVYAMTERGVSRLNGLLPGELETRNVWRSYVRFGDGETWRSEGMNAAGAPWFSAQGRRAIGVRVASGALESWVRYDGSKTLSPDPLGHFDANVAIQFLLVDLEHAVERPVFDAPTGDATRAGAHLAHQALWAEDERHVVLVNTAVPLGTHPDAERMAFLVSYDVETGLWDVMEPVQSADGSTVSGVDWLVEGQEFLVRHQRNGQPVSGTAYVWDGSQWSARPVDPSTIPPAPASAMEMAHGLRVEVRQGANEPPLVVASHDGREANLLPPDPVLSEVRLTQTRLFRWVDSSGETQSATLLLPVQMPAEGETMPLVIQYGIFEEDQLAMFSPDGPVSSTAYAAQALAAMGMAVLNLDYRPIAVMPRSDEAALQAYRDRELEVLRDWVDTSVAALMQTYPVDPSRVGVVGFSRLGYNVRYLITHPRAVRPAAALIADSYSNTYALMLSQFAQGNLRDAGELARAYGGSFYENPQSWLDQEVTFAAQRVQTPTLFAENNDGERLSWVIDTFGAFRATHRPFELMFMRDTAHNLVLPRVRQASLEATVDWFNFWLQDIETPRAYDPDRYVRWRKIRSDWIAQQAWEAHGNPAWTAPVRP